MTNQPASRPDPVCPYLGLPDDPTARYGFPTDGNACHREGPPREIRLDYQQDICLGGRYRRCPIYLQPGPEEAAPAPAARSTGLKRWFWLLGLLVLLAVLCGLVNIAAGWFEDVFGSALDAPQFIPTADTSAPVLLPSLTPLPPLDATQTPIELESATAPPQAASPTATETSTVTPTETPTVAPPTETPTPTETATSPPPSPTLGEERMTETPAP